MYSVHAVLVMLLHPGLNHLAGRSIDVALVEGDLEVVPRLGYMNRKIPGCWIFLSARGFLLTSL